ncbi:MAG TPA: DinB family protein [Vicinamibacterales bacterium]|nr:DinB family protein [Vicinamibacterales bacterium]
MQAAAENWRPLTVIVSLMETLHGETVGIIGAVPDLNAKRVTPDGAAISIRKWLRAMVEHEVHHRGQIYIYLAILNVPTPPLYGLTSEQLLERSVRS